MTDALRGQRMCARLQFGAGFTLIELLVVVLIIAVLIAVAAPSFLGQTQKAHDSVAKQYLAVAYKAAAASSVFHSTQGDFVPAPSTTLKLQALADEIKAGEPEFTDVVVGNCPDDATADQKYIVIDQTFTVGRNIKLCNDPDFSQTRTVWTLTVIDGGVLSFGSCTVPGSCDIPVIVVGPSDPDPPVPGDDLIANAPGVTGPTYTWRSCDDLTAGSCTVVGGDSASYTVTEADNGLYLEVEVIGIKNGNPFDEKSPRKGPVGNAPPLAGGTCSGLSGDMPQNAGPPANDDFSNAADLGNAASGSVNGSFVGATVQGGTDNDFDESFIDGNVSSGYNNSNSIDSNWGWGVEPTRSLWYCWTAPASLDGQTVAFDTKDSQSYAGTDSKDAPQLGVFKGSFLDAFWDPGHASDGLSIAGDYPDLGNYFDATSNTYYSRVSFVAEAGKQYVIWVTNVSPDAWPYGSPQPDQGDFTLNWGSPADPDGDGIDSPPGGSDNCPNVYNPGQENNYHGDDPDKGDACTTPPAPPTPAFDYPLVFGSYERNHDLPTDTYSGWQASNTGDGGAQVLTSGTFPYASSLYGQTMTITSGTMQQPKVSPDGLLVAYLNGDSGSGSSLSIIQTDVGSALQGPTYPIDVTGDNPAGFDGGDSDFTWLSSGQIAFVHHHGCGGSFCDGHPSSYGYAVADIVLYTLGSGTYTVLHHYPDGPDAYDGTGCCGTTGNLVNGTPARLTYSNGLDQIAYDVGTATGPGQQYRGIFAIPRTGGSPHFIAGSENGSGGDVTAYDPHYATWAGPPAPSDTAMVYRSASACGPVLCPAIFLSSSGDGPGTDTDLVGGSQFNSIYGLQISPGGSISYCLNTDASNHLGTLYVGATQVSPTNKVHVNWETNPVCTYAWGPGGNAMAYGYTTTNSVGAPSALHVLNPNFPTGSNNDAAVAGSDSFGGNLGLSWGGPRNHP